MKEKMMKIAAVGIDLSDWAELADEGYKFISWYCGYSEECEDFEEVLDEVIDSVLGEELCIDFDKEEDIDHEAKIVNFGFTY